MAEVAKNGVPSLATTQPGYEHQLNGLIAGEDLAVGDFVYIKESDGRVWKASGAAVNEAARARGVILQAAKANKDGVSIHHGVVVRWGAALRPGVPYYLSATVAGALNDAATTGGTTPIAFAVDATRLYIRPAVV
jgi:hypothetical protein